MPGNDLHYSTSLLTHKIENSKNNQYKSACLSIKRMQTIYFYFVTDNDICIEIKG
jgi:hypothetical protein